MVGRSLRHGRRLPQRARPRTHCSSSTCHPGRTVADHAMTRTPSGPYRCASRSQSTFIPHDQGTELVCHDGPAEPFIDPRAETYVDIDRLRRKQPRQLRNRWGRSRISSKPAIEMPRVQTKPPRPFCDVCAPPATRSRSTAIPVTVAVLSAVSSWYRCARAGPLPPRDTVVYTVGGVASRSAGRRSAPPMSIGTATGAAPAAARNLPVKPALARKPPNRISESARTADWLDRASRSHRCASRRGWPCHYGNGRPRAVASKVAITSPS